MRRRRWRRKPRMGAQRASEITAAGRGFGPRSSPIFGNDHKHKANYLAADAAGRVADTGIDYPTALVIATKVYENEELAYRRELEMHCCL